MATVLIADDSPTLRRIVSSVLSKEGHDVVQACDGVQALQLAFAHQPDAIVLDVQMPRVSGYVAARLLKDDWQTADVPVVMLTSLDTASDRYWGAQAGADRYLTKDFAASELAEAVQQLLAAGSRPAGLRPEPVVLSDDDVLGRVCELLDRKLFESSVAGEVIALAASGQPFESMVAGLLGLLAGFVDYDLASVVLAAEQTAYVAVARPATAEQYQQFLTSAADAVGATLGRPFGAEQLQVRVADPDQLLVDDSEDLPGSVRGSAMRTFLTMPLRGAGELIGVLALSSAQENAFGEVAMSTLRLVDGPASLVIDNGRLARERV